MRKSKFCENESPVYVSDNMTGKMAGIPAISTSCFENIYCAARYEVGVEYVNIAFRVRHKSITET